MRTVVGASCVALAAVLLSGCKAPEREQRAEFAVFGTRVEAIVRGADEAQAAAAFRDVGAVLQRLHRELHPWEDGALMQLNEALAQGRGHRATEAIVALVRAGRRLELASGGTFNPAIGAAVSLWGFHTSSYPITEPPPSGSEIRALLDAAPSMRDLTLDGREVSSSNPAVRLDFSGLAKGFALGLACDALVERGIESGLVNAGGDVMVCGSAGDSWRVAIRDPDGGVLETLDVDRRLAVFTSGNYHRYGEFDGERYAHILDPRTARPVADVIQATVIDPDPLLADAAATALVAAGRSGWREVAESMALDRAVVVLADGSVERLDSRMPGRR